MRIVAGRHKGRRLTVPPGQSVRPTSDKARAALFDILAHGIGFDLEGVVVVDAFAGSGALGLEALSRGAGAAVFIDRQTASLACIKENCAELGEEERTLILRGDARRPPAPPPFVRAASSVLGLFDPPYHAGLIVPAMQALYDKKWFAADTVCVAEMGRDETPVFPEAFVLVDERVYGAARLVFLRGR